MSKSFIKFLLFILFIQVFSYFISPLINNDKIYFSQFYITLNIPFVILLILLSTSILFFIIKRYPSIIKYFSIFLFTPSSIVFYYFFRYIFSPYVSFFLSLLSYCFVYFFVDDSFLVLFSCMGLGILLSSMDFIFAFTLFIFLMFFDIILFYFGNMQRLAKLVTKHKLPISFKTGEGRDFYEIGSGDLILISLFSSYKTSLFFIIIFPCILFLFSILIKNKKKYFPATILIFISLLLSISIYQIFFGTSFL